MTYPKPRRHIIVAQDKLRYRTLCGWRGIGAPPTDPKLPLCQHCERVKRKGEKA